MRRRTKPALRVMLEWRDRVGINSRTLPVALACPDCGSQAFKRLDSHGRCTHSHYLPVECLRCSPPSWWAQPKSPASTAAAVAAAERRSIRARVSGWVDGLVARVKGRKKTGENHGS